MNRHYDYAVIGAGPGGLTVAIGLGAVGKKVCLIEKGHIGGDCTNYGCVPSKALLSFAKKHTGSSIQDAMKYVREKRQEIREEETPEILSEYGVDTIFGKASFEDEHTLIIERDAEVGSIHAKKIIIATGSRPRWLDIPGVKSSDVLTSETLFEVDEDIKKLVIIGGGVIACEIAEAFCHLGVQVTILAKHDRLLSREEPEISAFMHAHLQTCGVTIRYTSTVQEAHGKKLLLQGHDSRIAELPYDKILVAIGRTPNTDSLGVEKVGIDADLGGVIVDTKNRTTLPHVFAIGDCISGNPKFTHRANNEGRILVQNVLSPIPLWSSRKGHPLPMTIYTSYEVARVGLTEQQAKEKYGDDLIEVCTLPFSKNDRSKLEETTHGFIKISMKRVTLKIVGVSIVGLHAGEMLPQYTIAMKYGLSLRKLSKVIYAYPTRSEALKVLMDEYLLALSKKRKSELIWFLGNFWRLWK